MAAPAAILLEQHPRRCSLPVGKTGKAAKGPQLKDHTPAKARLAASILSILDFVNIGS
jgi:hypothetical protein